MTAIVVLGDVHGNARALTAALAQAVRGPMDALVFLGDLLTYGPDVDAVLDLVAEAQERHGATLLLGNHDQLYLDLAEGRLAYFDALPAWIRESVELTAARLDAGRLRSGLRWCEERVLDDVLFAHANPFGFADWRYLNGAADVEAARRVLADRALRAGVFGHTHRARWAVDPADPAALAEVSLSVPLAAPQGGSVVVANAGSVGQPRDASGTSLLLRLITGPKGLEATFEPLFYDVDAHLAALRASGVSAETFTRLARFFRPT
jgi:predicted phosphodiesterase